MDQQRETTENLRAFWLAEAEHLRLLRERGTTGELVERAAQAERDAYHTYYRRTQEIKR